MLAGILAWLVTTGVLAAFARLVWPAYAAAVPQRHFTTAMLVLRLVASALGTIVAGAVAQRIGWIWHRAALASGLGLLAISLVRHYQIWSEYPVWYHLVYLVSLVPLAVLGGRLVAAR